MLLDKGYYDYDFEPTEIKKKKKPTSKTLWSDDKVKSLFAGAIDPNTGKRIMQESATALSVSEAQELVMRESGVLN